MRTMNVSELARKLRISVQELRDILPHLGFDIGAKAIKIDNVVANRILKDWQRLYKEYNEAQATLKKEKEDELRKNEGDQEEEVKTIYIPSFITVKDFSHKLGASLVDVMQELMKNGVLATLNDKIDYETAAIIADEFHSKAELKEDDIDIKKAGDQNVQNIIDQEDEKLLKSRPPVVVVMGHVDHGKTKLLDVIRKTNVIDKEAGGITQHMGAYQVKRAVFNIKNGAQERIITFIDTPGHEAFTAMRSRGAKIADIAILVVAADDGVKPQTKEALKIIEQTGIPMIVAINKIDKPGANIEKTKQELSSFNVIPEDWGGNAVCVPISAKDGTGIDELLETIILTADLNEDKIKANPEAEGLGTVIESHIDKGEGAVATILAQNGSIRKHEYIVVDGEVYGRIRLMKDYLGNEIQIANPSTPIKVIGLKMLPKVGDIIKTNIIKTGKQLKKKSIAKVTEDMTWQNADEEDSDKKEDGEVKKVSIILKSDVVGSLGAIIESLAKIESKEVKINIVKKGLGNITEADVSMAEASGAIILGFNVLISSDAEKLALEKNIEFYNYKIIYELLDFIKEQINKLTTAKYEEILIGKAKVLAIFRTEDTYMIVGCKITNGEAREKSYIRVYRGDAQISKGELVELQSGKQKVNVAINEEECGIQYKGDPVIKEGDVLEFWIRKEITY